MAAEEVEAELHLYTERGWELTSTTIPRIEGGSDWSISFAQTNEEVAHQIPN